VISETEPTAEVATFVLAVTAAAPVTVTEAVDTVAELPVTGQIHAFAVTVTEEVDTVAEFPEADTTAAAATVTEPTLAVPALPVTETVTSTTPPHVDDPHVLYPQVPAIIYSLSVITRFL
jgi:hypothetical protein